MSFSLYDKGTLKAPNVAYFHGSSALGDNSTIDTIWTSELDASGNLTYYIGTSQILARVVTTNARHLTSAFKDGYPISAWEVSGTIYVAWWTGISWITHTFTGSDPCLVTSRVMTDDPLDNEVALIYLDATGQTVSYRLASDSFTVELSFVNNTLGSPCYLDLAVPYTAHFKLLFSLKASPYTSIIRESDLTSLYLSDDFTVMYETDSLTINTNFTLRDSQDSASIGYNTNTIRIN